MAPWVAPRVAEHTCLPPAAHAWKPPVSSSRPNDDPQHCGALQPKYDTRCPLPFNVGDPCESVIESATQARWNSDVKNLSDITFAFRMLVHSAKIYDVVESPRHMFRLCCAAYVSCRDPESARDIVQTHSTVTNIPESANTTLIVAMAHAMALGYVLPV
jgi:hypothetical protein